MYTIIHLIATIMQPARVYRVKAGKQARRVNARACLLLRIMIYIRNKYIISVPPIKHTEIKK